MYFILLSLFTLISTHHFHFEQIITSFRATLVPHPQKAHRGGQDAFAATSKLLVVSDGVGGWSQLGIDPSFFARTLCSNAQQKFNSNQQLYKNNPEQLMTDSVNDNFNVGSATMTVLTLDNNFVHSANIGDSGYLWLRRNLQNNKFNILFKSPEQQHSFNFPFQLMAPNSTYAEGDKPQLSNKEVHEVKEGDYFIVGSDGLFDNLEIEEIIEVLQTVGVEKEGIMVNKKEIADLLANKAISYGQDNNYLSPFAKLARKSGFQAHLGGKLDDTTVIVAQYFNEKTQQDQL